jgi:hypothetical protein
MSTTVLRPPAVPARQRRHRFWILSGAVVATVASIALTVHGIGYYALPQARRVLSPHHDELKAGGSMGIALGIAGSVLLLLMYLYPLRKRWKWLSKKGKTKHWLDYHILMGLTAPVLITLHSSFKLNGIAGLAYWSMIAVVVSGIVGRYLYGRIPRKLGQAEMSMEEAERVRAALAAEIDAQNVLPREQLAPLMALPAMEEVQRMPMLKALAMIVGLDLRRGYLSWRLRRHVANSAEVREVLAVVGRQAALSKDILFLFKMRRLFQLWHVVHRPFSYSLAVLAILHIVVVTFLGYF